MGGSFSPFHMAHLNSLLTVRKQLSLQNIVLVPSFRTPLKDEKEEISPLHRESMLKRLLREYPFMSVDNQEILRAGLSYTYKTISQLFKERPKEELFFIMGLDPFYIFDRWKNFKEILQKTHLVVTSRPGFSFPQKAKDFPNGLIPLIKKRWQNRWTLKETTKKIYFCHLKDMDISSSDIKQQLKEGRSMSHFLPQAVDEYIKENQILSGPS